MLKKYVLKRYEAIAMHRHTGKITTVYVISKTKAKALEYLKDLGYTAPSELKEVPFASEAGE